MSGINYYGTDGNDLLVQSELNIPDWSIIYGGSGDDTIVLGVGTAIGDAGNEKIIGKSNASGVFYWTSPKGIVADFSRGLVEDGFGTIDTLTNIRTIQGSPHDDRLIGSAMDENFAGLGGNNFVDGRGGRDLYTVYRKDAYENSKISYDKITDTFLIEYKDYSGKNYIDELVNIHTINLQSKDGFFSVTRNDFIFSDFRKFSSSVIDKMDTAFIGSLKVGDFNGDDIDDILFLQQVGSGKEDTQNLIYLGDGSGSYFNGTFQVFAKGSGIANAGGGRALVADLNNDGVDDIFQIVSGDDAPPFPGGLNNLFVSNSDGKIYDLSETLQQKTQFFHGASLGDVNSDGFLDLLLNSISFGDANYLFINNGTGTYSLDSNPLSTGYFEEYGSSTRRTSTYSALLDVNNDGYADAILGKWSGSSSITNSLLFLNDGTGQFSEPVLLPSSGLYEEIVLDIKPIDLNGDSLPDLMLSVTTGSNNNDNAQYSYMTPYIQLLVNRGKGVFVDETDLRLPQLKLQDSGWFMYAEAVDFNRDGHHDILATSAGFIPSVVYLNDGYGVFSKAWESAQDGRTIAIDADLDGLLDLGVLTQFTNSGFLDVYKNVIENNHIYKANFGGERLLGSQSSDSFFARNGKNSLNGGEGIDFYFAESSFSSVKLSSHGVRYNVSDPNKFSNTTLMDIERIVFSDKSLALDISNNAGTVAKILGAVVGKQSLANKEYVGIGLDMIDKGMSYSDLAALALQAVGLTTNDQIVTALWTNVVGSAPSVADKAPFIEMLENGFYRGELAKFAAETAQNAVNIDLVGLAQTGIEYLPVA